LRSSVEGYDQLARSGKCAAVAAVARYRWARIQFENNRFEDAERGFREVVQKRPENPLLLDAANRWFSSLILVKRYDDLQRALDQYCDWPELSDADFQRRCEDTKVGLALKAAENFERDKRFDEAARAYLEVADRFPHARKHDELLYNATIHFRHAGNEVEAAAVAKRLIAEHPKSPLTEKLRR
jgi:TolA-binding protein